MKAINFDGKAMEYFGIWIANIVLNVVTLGIFSAWAKVRKLRYFYNNTKILGTTSYFGMIETKRDKLKYWAVLTVNTRPRCSFRIQSLMMNNQYNLDLKSIDLDQPDLDF